MTETPPGTPDHEARSAALVAELAKRTGVSWVRLAGGTHPVWHAWVDGALCIVSGGDEQPLPATEDGERVEVVMRSKENGGRLVSWVGEVSDVQQGDEHWVPVTTALVAGRLNLGDLATAADGWAQTGRVRRIVPTGEVTESPGSLPDGAHRATPLATPATTRGRLPRVLHRRVKRRPRLS